MIIITQCLWFIVIIYRIIFHNIILLLQPNQDRNQSNQDRNQPNQDRNQTTRNPTHNQPTPTHYESELRRSQRVIKTPKRFGESV